MVWLHNRWVTMTYEWRSDLEDAAVNGRHAEGFGHRGLGTHRLAQMHQHDLGWLWGLAARRAGGLVNVARDGGAHAMILGRAAGVSGAHVDFESHRGAWCAPRRCLPNIEKGGGRGEPILRPVYQR
jgi:hypothetical protein